MIDLSPRELDVLRLRSGCTTGAQLGVWAVRHGFVSIEEQA